MPAEIAHNSDRQELKRSRRALVDRLTLGILPMNDSRIMSKDVLVPLGLVGGVAAAAGAAGSWAAITSYGHGNDLRLQLIETKIGALVTKVDDMSADRWTGKDMRIYSQLLQASNPELRVPDLGQ